MLQARLVAAFPDCTDLSLDPSRDISAYCPHLSLGQWRQGARAQQVDCMPRCWTCNVLQHCIMSQRFSDTCLLLLRHMQEVSLHDTKCC